MAGVELYDAVLKNDLDDLKRLVKQRKLDVNALFQEVRDEQYSGMCPLHLAVSWGHEAMADFLLQAGTRVNVTTVKFRRTPLHFAVLNMETPCMFLLLHSGANLDARDIFGNTPCHYSAGDGCRDMLDVLIRSGADVDAQDISLKTPLMQAVRNKRRDAARCLLRTGADTNLVDGSGDVALHFAARNGLEKMVEVLLSGGSRLDVQNCWGYSPLMEAVANNRTACVQRLIDAGCDLHCQEQKTGATALHMAVKKNEANLVRLLLKAGSRHDLYNHQGESAIFEAVALNKVDLLRLVVDFNCKLDSPLKFIPYVENKSAFQVAAERGHLSTCCLLAELGHLDYSARELFYISYLPARPGLSPNDDALAVLQEALERVTSLRQLCRKVVRRCCDHRLFYAVETLPVPRGLKDFILVKRDEGPGDEGPEGDEL